MRNLSAFDLGFRSRATAAMRRAVGRIACLGLLSVMAYVSCGFAAPVHYTIDFGLDTGTQTPSAGSFAFDPTLNVFTDFNVTWDGRSFDFTSGANAPIIGATIGPRVCAAGLVSSPLISFQLLNHELAGCEDYRWQVLSFAGLATLAFLAETMNDPVVIVTGDGALPPPPVSELHGGTFAIAQAALSEPSPVMLLSFALLWLAWMRAQPAQAQVGLR